MEIPKIWESSGPSYNVWYVDTAKFMAIVQQHSDLWLRNSQLKYLNIRMDTRSGHFRLTDRDSRNISPIDVLDAIRASRRKPWSKSLKIVP